MDNDQLIKRVEWLDKERLEDKAAISNLKERLEELEGALDHANKKVLEADSEITRLNVIIQKVEKFEATLSDYSASVKKELDGHDKRQKKREQEVIKQQQKEFEDFNKTLAEYKKGLLTIENIEKDLKSQKTDHDRLGKTLNQLGNSVDQISKEEDKRKDTMLIVSETQKKDAKRAADLQGEVAAFRKRLDEFGGKMELILSDQSKNDARLNEIQSTESERRNSQSEFTELITQKQEDRDRLWKDWSNRFDIIETQSEDLAKHLRNISDAELGVKRAQQTFDEITDQISRRINEITEMQRLGEEKFRQEFANFKADDQKRWTSYSLTQQEVQNEFNRILERLSGETANLDDMVQEIQDVMQHLSDQSEKQLETMLANMKEWVAENKKFQSSVR